MSRPWARISTLAIGILFALTTVAAAGNVDWSEYVDHSAKTTPAQTATPTASTESRPRVAEATSKPAKTATKTKAKSKAKAKARSTKKRRH